MSEMIKTVAKAIRSAMEENPMVRLQANGPNGELAIEQFFEVLATAAIAAARELPGDPGLRYTAGEYSRRTQESMVDDALDK